MRRMWGLRGWLAVQALVPAGLALDPALVGTLVTHVPYVHGSIKALLITWQSLLLRETQVFLALAVGLVAGGLLTRLRGRAWVGGLAAAAVLFVVVVRPQAGWTLLVLLAVLAGNLAPGLGRFGRVVPWIPGSSILFPLPAFDGVGGWPRLRPLVGALAGFVATGAWLVGETSVAFDGYERALFAPWPVDRVDPRVTTVAVAPEGVKCDFHDIDVLDDRVVVTAEGQFRLLSFPKDGGEPASWPLSPYWGPREGLAMDSESSGTRTWFLQGPETVQELAWSGSGWTRSARTPRLPTQLDHAYFTHVQERSALEILTVGTQNMREPVRLVEIPLPSLAPVRVRFLRRPDGSPPPTFRDLAWIPTMQRFVLAPDFGESLYLYDPNGDVVTPWIETPTLDGRITWVPKLERLLMPLPNRAEIWLIDPATSTIERRIPTQPGVRTAAIDVDRGLLLTASLLTGQVLVQRLEDGAIVDHFGTIMPMVRNLVLDTARGEAWLSTWTALYRIPYAPSWGAVSN